MLKDLQNIAGSDYASFYIIQLWETVLPTMRDIDKYTTEHTLKRGLSKTYIGNFYGLLANEYGIPMKYWYVHLRVNGLTNSLEYNGFENIKIINLETLNTINNLLEIDIEEKKKYGIEVR